MDPLEQPPRQPSSEPASTRLNPFDDADSASRKRRRTSGSVDIPTDPASDDVYQDQQRRETDLSAPPRTPDRLPSSPTATKRIPHTPSRSTSSDGLRDRRPPDPQSSSKVTINLRTPAREPTMVSGSESELPGSPQSQGSIDAHAEDDVSLVPNQPPDVVDLVHSDRQSSPSSIDSASPPVELIQDPDDDEDINLDESQDAVALPDSFHYSFDPSDRFPYHDSQEALYETADRLVNYLGGNQAPELAILEEVQTWLVRFVDFARNSGPDRLSQSLRANQTFWAIFPLAVTPMLRQPLHRIPAYRDVVLKFYNAYIDLAVHLVKLDTRRLENARLAADGGTQHPIALLFSGPFMKQVYVLTHRNAAADIESNNTILEAYGTPGDDISMFMDKLESCSEDILCLLSDFATALADALSASPKLIEAVGPLAHVVNNVLEETATRNETEATDISPETSVLIARLQQGHRLFDTLSGVVSDLLNKHVSQITKDGIENSITSLSELLMTSLTGPHDAAVAMVQDHTAKHPEVPPELTAEAIALEWRLGMMERLIRCSQMQLRVTGAVSLCSELVSLWKRLAEDSDNALLKHVAHRLHDSGLIDYIIGPNSHPEIIIESGNVVGFLMVTKMYRPEHTDRLWQAMTGNLDLRAGEATIRMLSNIVGLFDYTAMEYLCAKFDNLPIANFTPLLRQLWDNLLLHMVSKYRQQHDHLTYQPYALCLRLVRESSVLVNGKASNQGLQSMATQKLSDILQYGPDVSGREKLYRDCLQDLSLKTPTTLGSLWCLWMTIRSNIAHEMHILAQEHDLARLLVGELEHAVEVGAANSSVDAVVPVVSGPANHPRLEFLANLIRYEPNSIVTADGTCDGEGDDKPKGPSLDRKLWDLLVGPQSLSREDREAGWKIFNNSRGDAQVKNAFIRTCTTNHLPTLPASCFCEGTLEFVRWEAHALVRMTDGFSLDDEPATRSSCLEQLWRLILESPDARIAARAISIMITEVYLDSDLLLKYPARQTRQVHSSLTTRCLSQLKDAAAHIRNPLGESAPAQDLESSLQKQKLIFGRSLQFLRHFLDSYQSKPELSAPDVRAISRRTPSEVSGDLAQLKYQSFDGVHHTDVKPLRIGLRNTAGSLLASIRRETGFDSYKAYYRGQRFWPTERDVSLSLEDLNIQEGLILVRREEDDDDQSSGKDGEAGDESLMTMSLSEEILSHFQEMWGYLDMEEDVAREIYNFLVRLPADSGFIKSLADPTASYKDIFPRGQPFRSLYAIHALFEYKNLAARAASCAIIQDMPLEHDGQLEAESTAETEAETGGLSYSTARERSVALILRAILDPDVVANTNARLELELTSSLMHILMQWLQESGLVTPIKLASAGVLAPPDRFIDILSNAVDSEEDTADSLAVNTFSVLLRLGLQDAEFWSLLARNEDFERVMCDMMLFGRQCKIRPVIYRIIQDATVNEVRLAERQPHSLSEQAMADNEVTESQKQQEHQQYRISLHFWKLALDLLPQVEEHADRCCDLFDLMFSVACRLSSQKPGLIDLPAVASMASELLLLHVPTESVDQPEKFDPVPRGLVSLLEICLQLDHTVAAKTGTNIAPIAEALPEHLAYDMFWNLLFPRARDSAEDPVPKVVLHGVTRQKVCDVIYRLVHNDRERFRSVLESMNEVLPHHVTTDDDTPYLYDIPLSFDRQKALRAPCGYVGLRNLSNTCYLNSLMTQLYMNPAFREFILSAEILDEPPTRQKLLLNTKKLFGFMQESYRRFVDPIDFVDSIMTYDNTHIDVTAQMDVDEFYNLLFDRWESQLLGRGISGGSQTASLKNKLRSFYGGQLVQQVKSMECGHISERLEPFSAIQCDVQGKSGLQDSLQAYVDGEVLEGDNKYKCSSCDRHVDAVKRACLKDLPDNIIFHLKRFEFNLRTLQRSKINDYFTFPDTINLKPYTAEALKDPDLGGEDMFELVGILVHAGTAESGHYYSYIRERPTKPNRPSWVEFNDETVTPWDPSLKESATFGGAEHRQPFDGNGCPYEKSYSAYMLFYQRTSSLKRQQAEMDETELSVPMHVSMEGDQMDHIKDENTNLLRRHCIFDPAHSSLVQSLFDRSAILDRTVDDADTASEKTVDGGGSETPSSMISLPSKSLRGLAMEMSLSYLDQVASRQQDERILHGIMGMMQTAAETSPQDAFWVYKYFYERPEAMRSLVQRNPDSSTRQDMVSMYLHALHKISEEMPRFYDRDSALVDEDDTSLVPSVDEAGVPVLSGVMVIFEHLWRFFQGNMRAWDEHFGFLRSFAQMGGRETARVLAEDYLLRLCRMVSADASIQMTPQYNRMVQNIQRRPNGKLPSYAEILRTIDHLLQSLAPELDADTIVEYPEDRLEEEHSPFSWSSAEAAYMHWHPEGQAYSFFVEKLVAVDQLPVVTDRIVMRLVQLGDRMDLSVAQALKANIRGDPPSHPVDSYLRVAMRYLSTTKVMSRAQALMTHVANEAKDLHMADMRALVVFFQEAIRLGSSDADTDVDVDPDVSDSGSGNPRRALREYTFELAPRWVPPALAHPSPDVRAISLRIVDTEILTEEPPAAGGLSETTEDVDPAAGEEDTEGTFFGGGSGHSGSQRDKVILRAQRLGVACLQHLRDNHVRPGAPISREQADPIARVIRRCRAYFDVEVNATEDLPMIFQILQEGVNANLRQLIVDQIDDDGTDWEGSCSSSQQMEGVTETTPHVID